MFKSLTRSWKSPLVTWSGQIRRAVLRRSSYSLKAPWLSPSGGDSLRDSSLFSYSTGMSSTEENEAVVSEEWLLLDDMCEVGWAGASLSVVFTVLFESL